MTSVSINRGLSNALIILNIDHTATVTGIDRVDMNGTRALRTIGNVFPQSGTGSFAISDYEAALSGLVEYRIHTTAGAVVARTTLGPVGIVQRPRFIIPSIPQHVAAVDTVLDYDETREFSGTMHQVIGRPDPLVILGELRPRTGSLKIFCATYAETMALVSVLRMGTVTLYRQAEHQGQDLYFIPTRYSSRGDAETGTWEVNVDYSEVAYPLANIRPTTGWTFNALAAEETNFTSVSKNYEDFNRLRIGERK